MTLSIAITLAITALAVLATAWTVLKAIREAYSDGYHQGWDDGQAHANSMQGQWRQGHVLMMDDEGELTEVRVH